MAPNGGPCMRTGTDVRRRTDGQVFARQLPLAVTPQWPRSSTPAARPIGRTPSCAFRSTALRSVRVVQAEIDGNLAPCRAGSRTAHPLGPHVIPADGRTTNATRRIWPAQHRLHADGDRHSTAGPTATGRAMMPSSRGASNLASDPDPCSRRRAAGTQVVVTPDQAPVAKISAPSAVQVGQAITFDASSSTVAFGAVNSFAGTSETDRVQRRQLAGGLA